MLVSQALAVTGEDLDHAAVPDLSVCALLDHALDCASCATTIETALRRVVGISVPGGTVTVAYRSRVYGRWEVSHGNATRRLRDSARDRAPTRVCLRRPV